MRELYEEFILQIKNQISNVLSLEDLADDELKDRIEAVVLSQADIKFGYTEMDDKIYIADRIFNSIRGFGVLGNIMDDESITEIMINGADNIFVEKHGKLHRIKEKFESEDRLMDVIQKIVGLAGREVNSANPIVDTRLPDGSRVNVVLPPIALNGPVVTVRKFSKIPMTIDNLISYKSITPEIADILKILVICKYNIFISGGTGSGKTTFLNALSNFIPHDERVITIEDSAELQIVGVENLVRLETRNANSTGRGELTIKDLIKSALRMRPERIVVGEVRGKEALDMLQAMNTGHDGSLSTGHANSTSDMLSRLETMVLTGSEGLPLGAVRQQITSAIDIIIHLSRMRDKTRKVLEICEVCSCVNGEIQLNPIYKFVEDENSSLKDVNGCLVRTENKFINYSKLHAAGIYETI